MTGDGFPHGENRGYERGCRCGDCRAAHSAYNIRRSHERAAATPPDQIPHGTLGGYDHYRCRCPECRAANADHQRRYRQRLRSGWRAAL